MTTEGFICISRGITAHWIWSNPVLFQRWVWMILTANYDNREVAFCGHRVSLQRGQLAVNLSYLSKLWNISSQAVSKFLVKLEVDGMVNRSVDEKVTIITICNYDRYQLKMGTSVEGLVDGVVYGVVEKVVYQTEKDNNIKTKDIEKTSNEVLCQVPLELDVPEVEDKDFVSWERFISFFNTAMRGKTIPKIRGFHLAEHRKKAIRARFNEYGKDAVVEVVKKAAASNFLNGGGDKGFVADIDWMMGPRNFPKILDGFYDRNFGESSQNSNNSNNKDNGRIRGTQATATSSAEYSKQF